MSWAVPIRDMAGVSVRLSEPGDETSAFGIVRAIGPTRLGTDLKSWDEVYRSPGGHLWTATYGEAVVGFAGQTDHEDFIMLHSDIVHPDAQGMGIGSALVLARIATTVFSDRTRVGLVATEYSRGFYERFGFRKVGTAEMDPTRSFRLFPMARFCTDEDGDAAWGILDSCGVRVRLDESGQKG